MKKDTIAKIFPVYSIENDLIISKNGDLTLGYKLMLPRVYSLSIGDINNINSLFNTIIQSLPDDTIIQKQDYFYVEKNIKNETTDENNILEKESDFFYEKPLLHQECYLFITKNSKNKLSLSSTQKCFDLYTIEVQAFLAKVLTSITSLENSGFFSVKQMDDEEIINIMGKYFSLSKQGDTSVKDIFFDKKLKVKNNFGEIYVISSPNQLPYMFNAKEEKEDVYTQYTNFQVPFIQPICLGLECNHIYNQVIYIDNNEDVFSKLKEFKSSPIQSKEYRITYNTEIDELMNVIVEEDLKIVNQHFSILLWDTALDKLQKGRYQLEEHLKDLGIISYQVKHGLRELYINNSPGAAMYIPNDYKFLGISKQVPIFFNLESYCKGNKDGILFKNKKKDVPIRLDLWEEPKKRGLIENRNRLVFGAIEKGETFLINHIISQYYQQGHQVFMLDVNDSYKKICNEFDGQYYIYDLDSTLKFNPFYVEKSEDVTVDKIVFLTLLIQLLWKGEGTYFLNNDKKSIANYIDKFYTHIFLNQGILPSLFSFYEFVEQSKLKVNDSFDKVGLLEALRDFYDGKYKAVFNSGCLTSIIRNRFVVFELSNIEKDPVLFPLISLLCVDLIMDKSKSMPMVKTSIFINQCWKPISKGATSECIEMLYKSVNDIDNELVIITKDIYHILESPIANFIITHTDTMIMFYPKNKKEIKAKLATHLSFTKSDMEKLFSTNKREVYIKVGNMSNIYVVDEMLCRLPRFRTPINLINNYY